MIFKTGSTSIDLRVAYWLFVSKGHSVCRVQIHFVLVKGINPPPSGYELNRWGQTGLNCLE